MDSQMMIKICIIRLVGLKIGIYPSKLKVNLIVFTPINLKFTWSVSLFQDFFVSLFGVVKKQFP